MSEPMISCSEAICMVLFYDVHLRLIFYPVT